MGVYTCFCVREVEKRQLKRIMRSKSYSRDAACSVSILKKFAFRNSLSICVSVVRQSCSITFRINCLNMTCCAVFYDQDTCFKYFYFFYFSCQAGLRFSKKALTPSFASSVVHNLAKASFI